MNPFIEEFFTVAKGRIDFIRVADDFGSQTGLTIGNDHWGELHPASH